MKILLAVDGSTFSDAAVKEVAMMTWPEGSELRIISAMEPPMFPTVESWVPPDNYIVALEKAAQEQARSIVDKAAQRVQKTQGDKLLIAREVATGHPKQVILTAAESWPADLIVLGSHGYRGLTRFWLGSVSQAVASHAK